MSESKILSVRLSSALKAQVDRIAVALDRPRNWVVNRAPEDYAATQACQIEEVRRGLAAAEAGDFAKPDDVKAAFAAFRRPRRIVH